MMGNIMALMMGRGMDRILGAVSTRGATPCALAAAGLALLCLLQALALLRMAPGWLPDRIDVTLARGAAIELGGAALAAPGVPGRALRVERDAGGRWWATTGIPARFEHGGARTRAGALVPRPGMRLRIGAQPYLVLAAPAGILRLRDGTHTWDYDGATLRRDGVELPPCPRDAVWRRWLPAPQALRFGGNLHCGTRIGNPDLAAGAVTAALDDGVASLAAAAPSSSVALLVDLDGRLQDPALLPTPLAGVDAIAVGRTRLRLAAQGDTLRLELAGRVALHADTGIELPPGVAWRWRAVDTWAWPPAALPWSLTALMAGALAAWLAWRCGRQTGPALACGSGLALALLGLGLLLARRAGTPAGAAPALLASSAALFHALVHDWRGGRLLTACAVLLLACGLLLQLELGVGAPDTGWLRHFQKTAALVTLGCGLLGCVRAWPRQGRLSRTRIEAALLALAALAVAALLVQVGWGDETGVFELQPVEFAKLALTVLAAHCVALGLDARAQPRTARAVLLHWLRLVAPALLFVLLLGVALVQVDDYSPLVLLLVWGAAMLLAWACAQRRRGVVLALAACACVAFGTLAVLRGVPAEDMAQWRFYGERFGVWRAPATHPHTGAQLLRAGEAIAAGGWLGADGAVGLATLGQGAGSALAIPAVQDDFAPAFLLWRHGLAAGLALWTLQALFLAAVLAAALDAWRAGARARHHHEAWHGRWHCFALCGGGAFVAGHFLLSWGTNLAFFPVMGQPMSFLSAGGSHLLFFIFPLLALGAASETT